MANHPTIPYDLQALDDMEFNEIWLFLETTYSELAMGLDNTPIYYMRTPCLAREISSMMDEDEVRLENLFDRAVWEAMLEIESRITPVVAP